MADKLPLKANIVSGTAMSLAEFDPTDTLGIASGGTGAQDAQTAIDTLTNVVGAVNEYVLTKDTLTGHAVFKVPTGGGSGSVTSVAGRTGAVVLTKADVSLGNVDNTSDVSKPVSTAQAASIATKQPTLVSGTNIKTVNGNSLLGSGDLSISGGGGYEIYVAAYAGADPTGATASDAAFASARTVAGSAGQVKVTKGVWNLASATGDCNWIVDAGATFTGAGSLTGRVTTVGKLDIAGFQGMYSGPPVDYMNGVGHYNNSPAAIKGISPVGHAGVLGASQSAGVATGMGVVGLEAYAHNNNSVSVQTVYASYMETIREIGSGAAHGLEIDIWNKGSTSRMTPNYFDGNAVTPILWLAAGADATYTPNNNVTCAIGIIYNGASCDKGIVFCDGSVAGDTSPFGAYTEQDAIAMPGGYSLSWWQSSYKKASIRGDIVAGFGYVTIEATALNFVGSSTSVLSATGGSGTLPANPVGFLTVAFNGIPYRIPYYGT